MDDRKRTRTGSYDYVEKAFVLSRGEGIRILITGGSGYLGQVTNKPRHLPTLTPLR